MRYNIIYYAKNYSSFTIHYSQQPKVAVITIIILLILAGVSLSFVFSGGSWDYTANVIQTGHKNIEVFGGEILNIKNSNKYITLYPVGDSTSEETDAHKSYPYWNKIYGDAIWETSGGIGANMAWYENVMDEELDPIEAFFVRGWIFGKGAGVFSMSDNSGKESPRVTSRITIVVE